MKTIATRMGLTVSDNTITFTIANTEADPDNRAAWSGGYFFQDGDALVYEGSEPDSDFQEEVCVVVKLRHNNEYVTIGGQTDIDARQLTRIFSHLSIGKFVEIISFKEGDETDIFIVEL